MEIKRNRLTTKVYDTIDDLADNPKNEKPSGKGSSKCCAMLEEQIGYEYRSMMLYHAMGIWMDSNHFRKPAQWFYSKGNEEIAHAKGIIDFMFDCGNEVSASIDCKLDKEIKPKTIREAFELALEHEVSVTKRIAEIQATAEEEGDRLTYNFLQAYLIEQIEEESVLRDYLSDLTVIQEHGGDMFNFVNQFKG